MKVWKMLKGKMKKMKIVCLLYSVLGSRGRKTERVEDSEYAKKNDKYVDECDIDNVDLFLRIDIETINRCNGTCPFCPVNAKAEQRPYAKMSEDLFKKNIIVGFVMVN